MHRTYISHIPIHIRMYICIIRICIHICIVYVCHIHILVNKNANIVSSRFGLPNYISIFILPALRHGWSDMWSFLENFTLAEFEHIFDLISGYSKAFTDL